MAAIKIARSPALHAVLSRRERQIMDVIYRLTRATVNDVIAELSGKPNYSTVRAQLRVLEEKGHLRHEEKGLRYLYYPTVPRHAVRTSALKHLIETFFDGSTEKVVSALLGTEGSKLSKDELDGISALIEKAKKERR
jgi:predicted transcriptional regulator